MRALQRWARLRFWIHVRGESRALCLVCWESELSDRCFRGRALTHISVLGMSDTRKSLVVDK